MSRGRLRIALIAPPWYPVPPDGYGGTELVVGLLARELRARGHDVVLFGVQGSRLATHPIALREWAEALGRPEQQVRDLTYAARVLDRLCSMGRFDVIHDHGGQAVLLGLALRAPAPVLHTVHGPLIEPARTFLDSLGDRVALTAISQAQRESGAGLPWVAVVHNAVDVDNLAVGHSPDRDQPYLLSLARICPDKGQHVALEVARRSGLRLVLAGKVEATAEGREYYETRIAPGIDGDRVIHIPNVAGERKARLLAGATALLAPLQWEEPFGLYMAEAMCSGTPVIAFPRGAAPELVSEGTTGFLVPDVDAMVAATGSAVAIDRGRCARHARLRFHPRRMAAGYVDAYARALDTAGAAMALGTPAGKGRGAAADGSRPAAWLRPLRGRGETLTASN
ncbi:MAG TPA: glycosyltransferase family 4 protein [Candidatus Binatia bacterium]|nr:glycosyltransferase family 4 protein [Candidatus Binatia bacterium]